MTAVALPGDSLTILVGPEGGFSTAEYEHARVAGLKAVSMGPRVLPGPNPRPLAALTIAQAAWGDIRARRQTVK